MSDHVNSSGQLNGIPFAKMTGSGNDFVFFDARAVDGELLAKPEVIRAICNRHNGIGADGLVLLEAKPSGADARIRYYNSDGSAAELCGNATLCSAAMAVELGLGAADALTLWTDAGLIHSRVLLGTPEIDLERVSNIDAAAPISLKAGESRIGFALVGVPHLVVLCANVETIDVHTRGEDLRRHAWLGHAGANVNFVSALGDGTWRYRTFERGVEGETLACGTGSIATGILLKLWELAASPINLRTSSGRSAVITLRVPGDGSAGFLPSLKGEGRVVFRGRTEAIVGAD
ncbi:MAG: diaminopimelate epimerase [Gemmatimonadaceae bacterium]